MPSPDSLPPLFDEFPSVSTDEWEDKIREDLGATSDEDVLRWDSIEGVSLPAYLRQDDLDGLPHVPADGTHSPLVSPDEAPPNEWQVRQPINHPDADAAHRLARTAVRKGASALGLSRAPGSNDWLNDLGVDTAGDLRTILADLPLDEVTLHLDGGPGALLLAVALRRLLRDREATAEAEATVAYDPVAALATGTLADADTAFALAADLADPSTVPWASRSVSLDLRPYHDAGGSAVQELAFGLGALTETLDQLTDRGRSLSSIVPQLQVCTSVSTSYFVEIAKLRALRLLVPQVLGAFADRAGAAIDPSPHTLFLQAETSRRTETLYDPYVNMLRATTEAMAAVIGGCDVLSVRPYDAALQPSDNFGARIARNVQLILRDEAHFGRVADPGAGAYYLEAATDQFAERAWHRFQSLEANGGLLDGLRSGRIQSQIESVHAQRREAAGDRDRVLVGTNHYPDLDETRRDDLSRPSPPSVEDGSLPTLPGPTLDALGTALDDGHSIPATLSALAQGSSPISPLARRRIAVDIEEMRLRTERHAAETGHTPTVLLVPLGPPGMRSARATFARNVFGVAGFDVVEPLKFDTVEEAADAAAEHGADLVVLCSADDHYPALAPSLRSALQAREQSPLLVVAGRPEALGDAAPVDGFVHRGTPLRDQLEALQSRLGMPTAPSAAAP